MADKELICRLCLNVITGHFQKMILSEENMLKYIRLDLYMSVTENPIICTQCSEILLQCYKFKMVCIKTENFLSQVYDMKKKTKLNLKYTIFSNSEHKYKCENEGLCRFCLGYLKTDSFMGLDKLNEDIFLNDMIHKCLPEFDLDITEQPAMCLDCSEKLQTLFNFMMACQDNDEKIKKMVSVNGVDSRGLVSLSDVLKFVDDMNNGDVRPLEEEGVVSFVKIETIETDDSGDTVSRVETLDNGMKYVFNETKEEMSSYEISLKEEEMRQFEEMKGDESNHEVLSEMKAKRQLEETKDDTDSLDIALNGEVKKVIELKKDESTKETIHTKHLCPQCDIPFHSQIALVNHLRTIHQHTCCMFKCDQCDFVTIYPDEIQTHISDFPHVTYNCHKCDFTTCKKYEWEAHRWAHDKPKTMRGSFLKCKRCKTLSFSSQMSLNGHILTHHPEHEWLIKGEVHRCKTCRFKTAYLNDWRWHRCPKVVWYNCDRCKYSTTKRVLLKRHKDRLHKDNGGETGEGKVGLKVDLAKRIRSRYEVLTSQVDETTRKGG